MDKCSADPGRSFGSRRLEGGGARLRGDVQRALPPRRRWRWRCITGWMVTVLTTVSVVHAGTSWPSGGDASAERSRGAPYLAEKPGSDDTAAQRSLIAQKVSLLENYLKSAVVAKIEQGGDLEPKELIDAARRLFDAAVSAMEQDRFDEANGELDDALRKVASAAKMAARAERAGKDTEAKSRYQTVRKNIGSYMRSLEAAASQDDASGKRRELHAQIVQLTVDAERLAGAGRYAEANELLSKAYRNAVLIVVEQGRGKTVVSRLTFASPVDELQYERERNDSYEMLVRLMLSERRGQIQGLRKLVDRYVGESRELRRQADAAAGNDDVQSAIGKMEEATGRLIQALRAGGIPVPE